MDGGRGPHSMHGSVGDVDVAHFQHEHVRAAAEAMGTEEVAPMVEGGVPVVDQKANIWLQSACCGPTGEYSVTKCLLWTNRQIFGYKVPVVDQQATPRREGFSKRRGWSKISVTE